MDLIFGALLILKLRPWLERRNLLVRENRFSEAISWVDDSRVASL
jgi:hypothetical protein